MGMCISHSSSSVGPTSTTKLILSNGQLQEFDHPIKTSRILERDSEYFLCDADDMEFDAHVTAVGYDEELRLGQIYFVLPKAMLKRPMCSEDLAKLAIKASEALVNRSQTPLDFTVMEKRTERRTVKRRCSGMSRGRSFVTDLSVIVE